MDRCADLPALSRAPSARPEPDDFAPPEAEDRACGVAGVLPEPLPVADLDTPPGALRRRPVLGLLGLCRPVLGLLGLCRPVLGLLGLCD